MLAACLCSAWTARTTIPAALVATQSTGEAEPTEPAYWEITVVTPTSPASFVWRLNAGTSINLDVDYGDGGGTKNYTAVGLCTNVFATAGTYAVRFSGGAASGLNIRFFASGTTAGMVAGTKVIGGVAGFADFRSLFHYTAITNIPSDLFRWNPQVGTDAFRSTFAYCPLKEFPADVFRHNTNAGANAFVELNYSNPELTSVPADLFRYCSKATSYNTAFYRCRKLQLRADLWGPDLQGHFDGRTVNFSSWFSQNAAFEGEQGTVPALWGVTNVTFTATGAFTGNSTNSLSNWTSIPTAWGGPL
jgi:hypothetical protein